MMTRGLLIQEVAPQPGRMIPPRQFVCRNPRSCVLSQGAEYCGHNSMGVDRPSRMRPATRRALLGS